MAKFATPFGFSAEGFVPGGEAGLEAFSALPGHEQRFIRDTGRSPTLLERETGVWDATPRDLFSPNIEHRFNMPVSPPMLEFENNTYQTGLSPEIEARIQQDASRGLFDVNERSVAQLGLQASPEHLAAGTLSSLPGQIREPSFRRWPLRVDPSVRIPRRTIAPLRPLLGKGGLTGLGLAAGLYSGGLSEDQGTLPEQWDNNPDSPTYGEVRIRPDSGWRGEYSPLRQQLPHTLFPPNYLNKMAGRSAVEGGAEKTRQDIGSAWDVAKRFFRDYLPARRPDPYVPDAPIWDPSKEQVPLGTPAELYKQRNDLEEMRFRGASIPPDFRVNATSMASLSPTVTWNPPPDPRIIEAEEKREQFRKFHPSGDLYMQNLGYEEGTGPIEEFKPSDVKLIDKGGVYQPEDIRMVGDQVLLPGETVVDTVSEVALKEAEKVRADNKRQADKAAARQKEVRADNQRRANEAREEQDRARENRERQEAQAERAKAIAKKSKAADDRKAAARQQRVADKAAQRERQATIQRQEDSRRRQASERAAKQAEKVRKAAIAAAKPTPVRRRTGGAPASRRVWKQPSIGRGR